MLVLLMHTTRQVLVDSPKSSFCFSFFSFGGAGVDFFFVLSGFIIAYSSLGLLKQRHYGRYISNRIIRIYPVYWIIFFLFLLPHIFFPAAYKTTYPLTLQSLLSALLLLPGHNMINGVSWTLSYELYFYLLFIVIFFFNNIKLNLVFMALYSAAIFIFFFSSGEGLLFLSPMILEFFMGIVAFLLLNQGYTRYGKPFLIVGGLLFLLSAVLVYKNLINENTEMDRVLYFGLPCFFIVYGSAVIDRKHQSTIAAPLLLIGDASYSLYLLHLPLVIVFLKVAARFGGLNGAFANISCIVVVGFIIWLATIFHKRVEKPLLKKLKNTLKF